MNFLVNKNNQLNNSKNIMKYNKQDFQPIEPIKLIQSFTNVILTVTTLTYAATPAINNNDIALTPNGNPKTTSLIIPDKNINPYPKLLGCLNTQ